MIAKYMRRRRSLLLTFHQHLKGLRDALDSAEVFAHHAFIRTSLLFVYDAADEDNTKVRIIDFPHVKSPGKGADGHPIKLSHRVPWTSGSYEDGYLAGLDNMITVFDELLADEAVVASSA